MVDFVNVAVVAAVAGFLLYELGWLSSAVTLSVAASYWCLFLLPTAYAVVTVLHPGFGLQLDPRHNPGGRLACCQCWPCSTSGHGRGAGATRGRLDSDRGAQGLGQLQPEGRRDGPGGATNSSTAMVDSVLWRARSNTTAP